MTITVSQDIGDVIDGVGVAGTVASDVVGMVAGLFPGAATVFNIIKLVAAIMKAAPAVYTDLESTAPVITRLMNSASAIMTAKSSGGLTSAELAKHESYVNAAQSAFASGLPLPIDDPNATPIFGG